MRYNVFSYDRDIGFYRGAVCAMSEHLPAIGKKCYFMYREVMVIKIWDCFHLAKIKEPPNGKAFYVDICTLTFEPDFTNSISLRLLRRKKD